FSSAMLEQLREKYKGENRVTIVEHDLNDPLEFEVKSFDVVISSFAIHHVDDDRKYKLYEEIWNILEKDGVFCNLEHVSSPTENLHKKFFEILDVDEDDSNILLDVETQLKWLNTIGFSDVDCYWKWRELALLVGKKY
ncbi:MAG: class I SAM-dependent methyltransferase, partial [Ignavibacteriaceae bacterium]